MQHGLMDINTMMTMLVHVDTGDAFPIVRTTILDPGVSAALRADLAASKNQLDWGPVGPGVTTSPG